MDYLTMGVFGTSNKKNEKRVPIHPLQIQDIDESIRKHLLFEEGYGVNFRISDEEIASLCGGVVDRETLFQKSQIALIAKPTAEDLLSMQPNTVHWGWPHCVQQMDMTQAAIDNRLTLIAWEEMHHWSENGIWQNHVFHKNNEIAGYAGVMHAMNLKGIDGHFGPKRKAIVFGNGSVSHGAIIGLQERGIKDIVVFTAAQKPITGEMLKGLEYSKFDLDENGDLYAIRPDFEHVPFSDFISDVDIMVNGILQDTDAPIMFVPEDKTAKLKKGCLIIDISCDEGMGFAFARPTTFDNPMFSVGHIDYYAVDHTPSYLWDAASWEISKGLIPFLTAVIKGPDSWQKDKTISKAIEINNGQIVNSKILSFQNRSAEYPYPVQ